MAKKVFGTHVKGRNIFSVEYQYHYVHVIASNAQFIQKNSNSSWDGLESKSKFLGFHNWLYQTRPLLRAAKICMLEWVCNKFSKCVKLFIKVATSTFCVWKKAIIYEHGCIEKL